MTTTRTGSFPIGFRNNLPHWRDDLNAAVRFATEHEFEAIDVAAIGLDDVRQILETGLRIGSMDLRPPWSDLVSADSSKRREAAEGHAQHIAQAVDLGVRNFFMVVMPEDPTASRSDTLSWAVDGLGRLCDAIGYVDARIVLEGWPGSAPHYSHLACTPESCRALFRQIDHDAIGVNFDPSHLIRMGIDPVRFFNEFSGRVHHVHAKDTQLLDDGLYEYGNLQPATLDEPHIYGGHHWRYCIPGHGLAPWRILLANLCDAGYAGAVSIELEDESFVGSAENRERGLIAARDFLVYL